MPFPHEDEAFRDLLEAAAQPVGLPTSLIEKDYWVSHALWSLQQTGFELWFKGGTSLSKGFGLIQRFSEDLDLKLEKEGLPAVTNWTSESRGQIAEREAFFRALVKELPKLSDAGNALDEVQLDLRWRSANIHVHYPGQFTADLVAPNRGYATRAFSSRKAGGMQTPDRRPPSSGDVAISAVSPAKPVRPDNRFIPLAKPRSTKARPPPRQGCPPARTRRRRSERSSCRVRLA